MVHALVNARGLLRTHGLVADLRPDTVTKFRAGHIQVHCLTGDHRVHAGRLKLLKPLADFRAADGAVREVIRRRLFRLRAVETFEFRYYFDTFAHLEKALARYWTDAKATLEDSTRRRLSVLLRRYPEARVMAVAQYRLNVLAKQ